MPELRRSHAPAQLLRQLRHLAACASEDRLGSTCNRRRDVNVRPSPSQPGGTRLSSPLLLGVFLGVLAGVFAVGAVALAAASPSGAKLACKPGRVCTPPPIVVPELTTQLVWHSTVGVRAEYDRSWKVVEVGPQVLKLRDANIVLWIAAVPTAGASLASLYQQRIDALRRDVPDLAEDTKPVHHLVGAEIGYVPGLGDAFEGALVRPPRAHVSALVLAARRGDIGIVASITTEKVDWVGSRFAEGTTAVDLFSLADLVLNSVRWPSA